MNLHTVDYLELSTQVDLISLKNVKEKLLHQGSLQSDVFPIGFFSESKVHDISDI